MWVIELVFYVDMSLWIQSHAGIQLLCLVLKLLSVITAGVCTCWYSVGSHTDIPHQLDCICGNYIIVNGRGYSGSGVIRV